MDKGVTQTNEPKNKELVGYAPGFTFTDSMCQEKKGPEDSPVLRIA